MPTGSTLAQRVHTDHAVVEDLFTDVDVSRRPEPGERPVDIDLTAVEQTAPVTLIRLVQAHIEASSRVMYPAAAESLEDGPLLARQAEEEHRTIREHLAVLQRTPPGSAEFLGALGGLEDEFHQHARPEEEMIDRLAAAVGEEQMSELHDEYELVRAGVLLGEALVPLDRVSGAVVESSGEAGWYEREAPS